MVFKGPRPPILSLFGYLFSGSLPEVIFSRFLSILGSPGRPFWSPWALFSSACFLVDVLMDFGEFGGRGLGAPAAEARRLWGDGKVHSDPLEECFTMCFCTFDHLAGRHPQGR